MAVPDDDFSVDATLTEGGDGIWSPPKSAPPGAPRDFQSLYEQQRARAEAAEARCEELHWAEVQARSEAGQWKWQFESSRRKRQAAVEETKEARRAARDVPSLQAEVARLTKLLSDAGFETGNRTASVSRRKAGREPEPRESTTGLQPGEARRLRKALETAQAQKETIEALRHEAGYLRKEGNQLRKAVKQAETHKSTIRSLTKMIEHLRARLRDFQDQRNTIRVLRWQVDAHGSEIHSLRASLKTSAREKQTLASRVGALERHRGERRASRPTLSKFRASENAQLREVLRRSRAQKKTIKSLRMEVGRLHRTLRTSQTRGEASEARLARLRAIRKTLSASLASMDTELRRVLRRSRRQKATIKSLSRENARLRKAVKGSRRRVEMLEAQLEKLRATGTVLSKKLYGRKSEQQDKPRSERKRGQQRGAPGHGRTQRPGLKERPEEINPPPDACVCAQCGQPYAPNGAEQSTLVEIEVKAHKRVISRPRLRRTCECASSPMEVSAPPVPRLFRRTPYGISFWARFLFEHCACFRPVHRVAAWFSGHGLPVSPGMLADSLKRFVPLFEPLFEAILAHQNTAALRHADETSWRVQELRGEDRSSRAWLWTSVSGDAVCFHIDASRSAEAALKLFAEALLHTVIVCDRYSAYKRLVSLLGGLVILAFCWSHVRRDFIECAAGQVKLTRWCQGWIERIAEIYRLNEARLEHYDPGLKRQTPTFDATQIALMEALDGLFADAREQLAALPDQAREGKALRSLLNHREGLCVFVGRPQTPMDNNRAERFLRGPAIGRGLSFGSDSEKGAEFTAIMYSVLGTLSMNGIDVLRWLNAWLTACAENGRRPPDDLSPWLPWTMSEERRRELTAPE